MTESAGHNKLLPTFSSPNCIWCKNFAKLHLLLLRSYQLWLRALSQPLSLLPSFDCLKKSSTPIGSLGPGEQLKRTRLVLKLFLPATRKCCKCKKAVFVLHSQGGLATCFILFLHGRPLAPNPLASRLGWFLQHHLQPALWLPHPTFASSPAGICQGLTLLLTQAFPKVIALADVRKLEDFFPLLTPPFPFSSTSCKPQETKQPKKKGGGGISLE